MDPLHHPPPIFATQVHSSNASPWLGDTEGGKQVSMCECMCVCVGKWRETERDSHACLSACVHARKSRGAPSSGLVAVLNLIRMAEQAGWRPDADTFAGPQTNRGAISSKARLP